MDFHEFFFAPRAHIFGHIGKLCQGSAMPALMWVDYYVFCAGFKGHKSLEEGRDLDFPADSDQSTPLYFDHWLSFMVEKCR